MQCSGSLTTTIARLLVKDLAHQKQIKAVDSELKACAAQISQDFEELVFLRDLAQNMEIRDDAQDDWPIAQQILPFLQRLVHAEAIILVASEQLQERGDASVVAVGAPVNWIGPRVIDDASCRQMVETYRDAARLRPVVKNHWDGTLEGKKFPGVHSFILVPVTQRDFTAGWVLALNRQPREEALTAPLERRSLTQIPCGHGLSDAEFGSVEASLLASTVTILATYRRNCELIREKEALLVNVVRSLASAIDAKDPYTCGHSERVAVIAKRLGEELGLSDRESEQLHLTGLLHDIGKIGVSESVLRKPGKLTPEEYEDLKRHPAIGHAILRDLTQISYVLPGVRHHHENYDGTGYPDGLVGDKIPWSARILAVADSYDAMNSDRPYRPGMPQHKIEQIFRSEAGTQWDPNVVACFLRLLPEVSVLCRAYHPIPHDLMISSPAF